MAALHHEDFHRVFHKVVSCPWNRTAKLVLNPGGSALTQLFLVLVSISRSSIHYSLLITTDTEVGNINFTVIFF